MSSNKIMHGNGDSFEDMIGAQRLAICQLVEAVQAIAAPAAEAIQSVSVTANMVTGSATVTIRSIKRVRVPSFTEQHRHEQDLEGLL